MLAKIGQKILALVMISIFAVTCHAQQSQAVKLHKQISLATFGSGSGNDCWGYVSPSGREYAIMGLNNKVAFVEITDPANAVIVGSVPHTASLWGSVKVYNGVVYAVTEASGTGIQVIDIRNIDNGVITLVRTIASPGRTHNVVMDEDNGFLYTVGSRNGTGTTMCFDLTDPTNPVQVGPASMTTNYHHDAQIVTYDSGPFAGKQIWYGFSEGRGIDIYDMTNKSNPVMIKRVIYPNMGYCHQGWLSHDKRYLYVDDEFDESNLQVPTRSLIFNVEDPLNAYYVGSFTTGLLAIDHNQYVDDGFVFQANYRSGLRVFEVGDNPISPIQTGWYDTFLADDNRGYDGAWSCYPFFPSGTVLVSDINTGLYILDVTDATTRRKAAADFSLLRASIVSGNLASLAESDGNELRISEVSGPSADGSAAGIESSANAFDSSPDRIEVKVVSRALSGGYRQRIRVFNWTTNSYDEFSSEPFQLTSTARTVVISNQASRYVQPGTNAVKVQIKWFADVRTVARLQAGIDEVSFKFVR